MSIPKNCLHSYMVLLSPFLNTTEWDFRKKEVACHVVPRQHYGFCCFFFNFESKEILSILLWLLVNSILTTSLFIIWTSTIKFLIGPRWLVSNPLVYRLMVGSASKFSTTQLVRDFKTKLLLFLKLTAILIRTFILCFRSQDKITTLSLLFRDNSAKCQLQGVTSLPSSPPSSPSVALL